MRKILNSSPLSCCCNHGTPFVDRRSRLVTRSVDSVPMERGDPNTIHLLPVNLITGREEVRYPAIALLSTVPVLTRPSRYRRALHMKAKSHFTE